MISELFKNTYFFLVLTLFFSFISCGQSKTSNIDLNSSYKIVTGAEQTENYLKLLREKNIAVVANQTSVIFKNGDMKVYDKEIEDWDIEIIFKDCKVMREALKSIILTGNFDLLDCMLEDKIETVGNINYAFKFMFLVNNLTQRIGIG